MLTRPPSSSPVGTGRKAGARYRGRRRKRRQPQKRERNRLKQARYRALLKSGGAVLTLHVRDKNALIAALLSSRWIEEAESESWAVIATRVGAMIDEFSERYGSELSPVDRLPEKPVPPSRP